MPRRPPRYRFVLVEEPELLPVVYRRPRRGPRVLFRRPDPLEMLAEAFVTLSRRGEGQSAWAPALGDNPLCFILDAVSDAVVLRQQGGSLIYRNRAAATLAREVRLEQRDPVALEEVQVGRRRLMRRCMAFDHQGTRFVIEVFEELERGPAR